jgi:hypothetical protein
MMAADSSDLSFPCKEPDPEKPLESQSFPPKFLDRLELVPTLRSRYRPLTLSSSLLIFITPRMSALHLFAVHHVRPLTTLDAILR